MGTWTPKPSAISTAPIISRKPRASMTMVGFLSMKSARGSEARSMTMTAMTTATIMIGT
ncbi:hypothetical protein D3C78_1656690 [compost metagenome]